jgi:MOSC domain-containing protein YiiM
MNLRVLSVNVGKPRVIGTYRGKEVLSGIAKDPVAQDLLQVHATNIEGDGQADLAVHGGVDKAVYAYPVEHWDWWRTHHALACKPAAFGENLTLSGADESAVAIGDRFRWGDAVLEVSQPRAPCYKFGIHAGREDAPMLMTLSARCGWYLRVVEEGTAPAHEATLERVFQSKCPSVREAFVAAMHPKSDRALRLAVLASPALSQAWRDALERRLGDKAANRG